MTLTAKPSLIFATLVMLALARPFAAQAQSDNAEAAAPKVTVAAAYSDDITEEAVFIGRGEAVDKVDIVARVSGFVDEVAVEDGATVKEGDLLFRIERDSYEATLSARQADLSKAEAQLDLARIELDRKSELYARGSSPESERDLARANELAAEAEVKAAHAAIRQAELELSYTDIHAPFDGQIGRANVSVGELVGPSTGPLVTLVRQAPMFVRFSLSEKQLANILEKLSTDTADLTQSDIRPDVYVTLPNGSDMADPGQIVFVDNRISPQTGTISMLAQFDNDPQLLVDGAYVQVRIEAVQPTHALLIPQAAIQRDQRGAFVLAVSPEQMVEQRYVTLGQQVGTAVVVDEGLREGESVIVEGLQRVRPGVTVDAVLTGQASEG